MKSVDVEAAEDRTRADGGHAIILLRGLTTMPDYPAFRLKPLETGGLAPGAAPWMDTDLMPLDVTLTKEGIAILVGPDVADSAMLLPGTAIEISMCGTDVRGEFLWPVITPLARPKRRNIMTRRAAGTAVAATVAGKDAGLRQLSPETELSRQLEDQSVAPSVPLKRDKPDVSADLPADPTVGHDAGDDAHQARETVRAETEAVAREASNFQFWPHLVGMLAEAPAAPIIQPAVTHPAKPRPLEQPVEEVGTRTVHAPNLSEVTKDDAAAAAPARPHRERATPSWPVARVAVTSVAAPVALQAIAMQTLGIRIVPQRTSAEMSQPVRAGASAAVAPDVRARAPDIYDVIAAGSISPRGVDASHVSPAKALERAHHLLHGTKAERDSVEAIFWLKRYLSSAASSEQARLVLTQLGSAYVQPVQGLSDFASARVAWEMAAALGDTVALCFLGATHERGLGTPADAGRAAQWYARAEAAGGACASVQHGRAIEGRAVAR